MKQLSTTRTFQIFIPDVFLIYLNYIKKASSQHFLSIYADEQKMFTSIFQKIFLNIWDKNKNGFKVATITCSNNAPINFVKIESTKKHVPLQKNSSSEEFFGNSKISDAEFTLKFEFKEKKLIISIVSEILRIPKNDTVDYLSSFVKSIDKAKKNFDKMYSEKNIKQFENIFDAFYFIGISPFKGLIVKTIKNIYPNILEHFPEFKNAPLKKQVEVLEYSCHLCKNIFSNKDIYCLAQSIFMALYDNNMTNTVLIYEHAYQKLLTFHKIKEYYRYASCSKNKIEFWRNNSIKFITYSTAAFKTSFMPYDLGMLLLKSITND